MASQHNSNNSHAVIHKMGLLTAFVLALAGCQQSASVQTDSSQVQQQAASAASQADSAHSHHGEHGGHQASLSPVQQAYMDSMGAMHTDMMSGIMANDADVAFAKGMLPHHQGAVAMAEVQLKYGKDDTMRTLAKDIIKAQQGEIELMQKWLKEHPDTAKQANTEAVQQAYQASMKTMHDDMITGMMAADADVAFAKGMLPHHQGAVEMAQIQLKYGKDQTMRTLAENIIKAQQGEIELMQKWLSQHQQH